MAARGHKLSDETRAKMRAAAQRRVQDPAEAQRLRDRLAAGRATQREKPSLEDRVAALEHQIAAGEARRAELLTLLQALERRLAELVERPPVPDYPPWAPWPGEASTAPGAPTATMAATIAEPVDDVPTPEPAGEPETCAISQTDPPCLTEPPADHVPDVERMVEPAQELSREDAAVAQLARLRRPKRTAPLLLASAEPPPVAEPVPAAEPPATPDEDPPPQPASAGRLPAPGAADEDVIGWTFRRALPGAGEGLYWTGGFTHHQDRTGKPYRLPVFGPRRCASTFAELRLARDAQRFTPELKGLFIVELT